MLEYAANGHYYWDRGELRSYLEATVKGDGTSVEELLSEFDPDEEVSTVDALLERFVENLREGQVRLVFFMEEAPQELKSIVDFLNRQTERTEILIVEARVFNSSRSRFVVPVLFGYTEEARRAKRTVTVRSGASRRKWDEDSFFAHAGENLSDRHVQFLRTVLDTAQRMDYSLNWGTGTQRGSFSLVAQDFCRRSMASFFSDGLQSRGLTQRELAESRPAAAARAGVLGPWDRRNSTPCSRP